MPEQAMNKKMIKQATLFAHADSCWTALDILECYKRDINVTGALDEETVCNILEDLFHTASSLQYYESQYIERNGERLYMHDTKKFKEVRARITKLQNMLGYGDVFIMAYPTTIQ